MFGKSFFQCLVKDVKSGAQAICERYVGPRTRKIERAPEGYISGKPDKPAPPRTFASAHLPPTSWENLSSSLPEVYAHLGEHNTGPRRNPGNSASYPKDPTREALAAAFKCLLILDASEWKAPKPDCSTPFQFNDRAELSTRNIPSWLSSASSTPSFFDSIDHDLGRPHSPSLIPLPLRQHGHTLKPKRVPIVIPSDGPGNMPSQSVIYAEILDYFPNPPSRVKPRLRRVRRVDDLYRTADGGSILTDGLGEAAKGDLG